MKVAIDVSVLGRTGAIFSLFYQLIIWKKLGVPIKIYDRLNTKNIEITGCNVYFYLIGKIGSLKAMMGAHVELLKENLDTVKNLGARLFM